jgi:hypothetical protein
MINKMTIGNGLGEITSELKTNDYIDFFVCLGPKSYGYSCKDGKKKICVKGIPQKICTDDIVTLPNMKKLIEDFLEGKNDGLHVTYPYKIWKNIKTGVVHSSPLTKTWKPVIDKRVIDKKTGVTYPFGF